MLAKSHCCMKKPGTCMYSTDHPTACPKETLHNYYTYFSLSWNTNNIRAPPPSKNELARSCKIVQESCMQDLLGTCTRYVPFLARFLHNLAPILARSCKKCANLQVIILAASLAKSCTISCKICARRCKNRARKGTYHVHMPSKSCMQDSCTILHDLASSFFLGMVLSANEWFYMS